MSLKLASLRQLTKCSLAVVLISVFSCLQAVADDSSALPQQEKITRLGVVVPLSGPLAFFGKDLVRAYELAVQEHPEIKTRVEVVWEDSAYENKKAISAFNKLVASNRADIIYSFGGPMLNVLAPLAEKQKIPFFATESQKSDCEGKQFCALFRNEEDEWGKATWQILRAKGYKKIGIVKNQNQFMDTFVEAIIRTKAADEKVDVLIDVPPETTDLRSETISLRSKSVDAIGVYLLPNSHQGFLQALKTLNIAVPMFGVEEFLDKELNRGLADTIAGTLVIAPGTVDSYKERFERFHGESAGFFYTPAFYDFLVLLSDTVSAKGPVKGAELMNALQFDGFRNGVSGTYSVHVSASGVRSYSFPIFVYEVLPDSLTVLEKISLP